MPSNKSMCVLLAHVIMGDVPRAKSMGKPPFGLYWPEAFFPYGVRDDFPPVQVKPSDDAVSSRSHGVIMLIHTHRSVLRKFTLLHVP